MKGSKNDRLNLSGQCTAQQCSFFQKRIPSSKTQSQEKQGMSTTQKTILGLGALAALTVGGLLVKRQIHVKNL